MRELFVKQQGVLSYSGHFLDSPTFTRKDVLKEVIKRNALLGRWTTHIDSQQFDEDKTESDMGWWYCVRKGPIDINALTAKQRYRVRRGLKNNTCYIATPEDIDRLQDEIYESYVASLAEYPAIYKKISSKEALLSWMFAVSHNNQHDIWICKDNETDAIIGFAHVCLHNPFFYLSTVKLNSAYFKNEINASLVYSICNSYLEGGGVSH